MPTRLHHLYTGFLEHSQESNQHLAKRAMGAILTGEHENLDERELMAKAMESKHGTGRALMPDQVYPEFADHYDIKGLFPPTMLTRYQGAKPFVPINFKTKPGEKRFYVCGLNSGSKTFTFENLVLLDILANIGIPLFGEQITIPKYDNIYYFRGIRSDDDKGQFATDLRAITHIANRAGPNDAVFFDEFCDFTEAAVADTLGPQKLEELSQCDATMFISSHRGFNHRSLRAKGWTILTPEHEIVNDEVQPLLRLRRGFPDHSICVRYMQEEDVRIRKEESGELEWDDIPDDDNDYY